MSSSSSYELNSKIDWALEDSQSIEGYSEFKAMEKVAGNHSISQAQ